MNQRPGNRGLKKKSTFSVSEAILEKKLHRRALVSRELQNYTNTQNLPQTCLLHYRITQTRETFHKLAFFTTELHKHAKPSTNLPSSLQNYTNTRNLPQTCLLHYKITQTRKTFHKHAFFTTKLHKHAKPSTNLPSTNGRGQNPEEDKERNNTQ